eukprot:gene7616-10370_t
MEISLHQNNEIEYVDYSDESMLADIHRLVSRDLSEPYSIFTYRYFIHNWPNLCICVYAKQDTQAQRGPMIATLVCKMEQSGENLQGYIAMLAVDKAYRKRGIALKLVNMGIERMIGAGCYEVVLEAEASNTVALALYSKLGFMKEEKLIKYYLNGDNQNNLK